MHTVYHMSDRMYDVRGGFSFFEAGTVEISYKPRRERVSSFYRKTG